MARFGWPLVAVGVGIALLTQAPLAYELLLDPTANDIVAGMLSAAGFWTGVVIAALGCVAVARGRGVATPPA